jgi:hypothetical protein
MFLTPERFEKSRRDHSEVCSKFGYLIFVEHEEHTFAALGDDEPEGSFGVCSADGGAGVAPRTRSILPPEQQVGGALVGCLFRLSGALGHDRTRARRPPSRVGFSLAAIHAATDSRR